ANLRGEEVFVRVTYGAALTGVVRSWVSRTVTSVPRRAFMTERLDDGTPAPEDEQHVGRRDVLKKGAVGVAATGIAWAAPTIQGLTARPDYAAAASAGCRGTFTAN